MRLYCLQLCLQCLQMTKILILATGEGEYDNDAFDKPVSLRPRNRYWLYPRACFQTCYILVKTRSQAGCIDEPRRLK
jgi:hypothetical protein